MFCIIYKPNWSNATKLIVFLASFFSECWESAYSPFLQIYYPALISEINRFSSRQLPGNGYNA